MGTPIFIQALNEIQWVLWCICGVGVGMILLKIASLFMWMDDRRRRERDAAIDKVRRAQSRDPDGVEPVNGYNVQPDMGPD